ncbi:LysM peptidoglycan-binding domain-containing protein [Frankia sp. Cr1]|uniref:CIS tube protein n=1 Tax=Frankia sp. Cr1 TaxID=3073931 RepID=UPI002AD2AED6|nr:LysM peptidoglycan-binding domain-containing protein [Frankia sp. Cr1]
MEFAKAYLCERDHPGTRVTFHFNPSTVRMAKRAEFHREPVQAARDSARPHYRGPGEVEMQFSLLLDASARPGHSVMVEIQQFMDWTNPTEDSRNGPSPSPPELLFNWGGFAVGLDRKFVGHLTSVEANCVLFSRSGAPIRAEVSLGMKATPQPVAGTNPTSGARAARRSHEITLGDTLAGIAYRTYGDAACWRALAEVNGVDDPMRLPIGRHLLLPARADLDRR